jgi:hypothetical protein
MQACVLHHAQDDGPRALSLSITVRRPDPSRRFDRTRLPPNPPQRYISDMPQRYIAAWRDAASAASEAERVLAARLDAALSDAGPFPTVAEQEAVFRLRAESTERLEVVIDYLNKR